jgi:hypothetical protein
VIPFLGNIELEQPCFGCRDDIQVNKEIRQRQKSPNTHPASIFSASRSSALEATNDAYNIRKRGFGPEETQIALGVSRDYKNFKDKKCPGHAPELSPLSLNRPKIPKGHLKDAPNPYYFP